MLLQRLAASTVLAVAPIFLDGSAPARADVHFRIDYTEIRVDGPPPSAVARMLEVALRGGNDITATEQRGRGRRKVTLSNTRLNEGFQQYRHRGREAKWRVIGPDALGRQVMGTTDSETVLVRTTGPDSCRASVTFTLRPGVDRFMRRNGAYRDIHAENVTCRVVTGD
jgi:hypothetical protein